MFGIDADAAAKSAPTLRPAKVGLNAPMFNWDVPVKLIALAVGTALATPKVSVPLPMPVAPT